ncbi:MAG: hypothetical protein Fur005_32460 [Roseiflexaceae bacterium]
MYHAAHSNHSHPRLYATTGGIHGMRSSMAARWIVALLDINVWRCYTAAHVCITTAI